MLSARYANEHGAVRLEAGTEAGTGLHIPHNAIHRILAGEGLADRQRRKGGRRKWARYERTHSNSMWHADYKQLDDGRWFIAYQDDASRFITGFGVFGEATGEHAIEVPGGAIAEHGRPASILTDRGSQFYANESEARERGGPGFERELARLEIRHILARAGHPQTNGKLERFHGELQRRPPNFTGASADRTTRGGGIPGSAGHVGDIFHREGRTDPVARLVRRYNHDRTHMSLGDGTETPAQAFARKMPPPGAARVTDGQTGEEYHVRT